MNIRILTVGKLKEKAYLSLCDEYVKRLSAFGTVTLTELPEARLPDDPSQAQIDAALADEAAPGSDRRLADEAARIRKLIPSGAFVTALCVEGKELSSPELAEKVAGVQNANMCFLIGGSNGLDEGLKREANLRLSFSRMTFPHHLFRVMLLEQVYRAFMINAGKKYHK